MAVHGHCDPAFARVRDEFERNFAERGELGASVCVFLDGEPVVDLWGGVADPETGREWQDDTVHLIMSCSKGLTALCGHLLIDRGQLDVDLPVAHYWPEFARNGKGDIPVRQVFTHQSGVAHVDGRVPRGGFTDWELMISLIEETTPLWEPGTRVGYHGMTFGWLIGELVRRITDRSIGRFFRDEIGEPLGVDCWIGLPAEHESRVAPSIPGGGATVDLPPRILAALSNPESPMVKAISNMGSWPSEWDTRAAHAAEIPAGGAISNARGLAGVYAPLALGGRINGVRVISEAAIPRMRYPQAWTDVDAVSCLRTCYTLGFAKSWPNGVGNSVIIGEDAFGTPGLGGQIGFADPSCRLSFAYTVNRHSAGTGLGSSGQALVDAVYRTVGSPTNAPGFWVRPEARSRR
ncbi:beta-lactamase family protein [Nocardia sp. NBC_00508]|uniref:serine hydrolase domain-containing protein n=1 Tax=Nocardia sp. NBC_00508 TaxID=2975992 RepID=UPI002E80C4BD|nr:serine hydrolase domain-containing protein [Nocardia sp. NBC_00508]WUD67101.1 beta-lactamase family protein [Nocardia sp. NBC_00508]